jgi:hypothetical protein
MLWIGLRSSVCLGVAACAAGVLLGCGQSSSGGDGAAAAAGGMGVGAHGGAGGSMNGVAGAGGSMNGVAGAGGSVTCPPGGNAGTSTGGEAGSGLACGMVIFTSPDDAPECEAWMERNCCDHLEACAASTPCKTLVACINACSPMSRSCIGCCTQGLTEAPPELDAIASCSKLGDPLPAGCEWPRTSEL